MLFCNFQCESHLKVYIITLPPAERVELLKPPLSEIEKMSVESEETYLGGLLKRYVEQPHCLQNITLAYWAAWYDSCGKHNKKSVYKKADIDNFPLETENGNNDELYSDENSFESDPSVKSIEKRSQARVIQSVWFNNG